MPVDRKFVVTRNADITSDQEVGAPVEGLYVAVVVVVALLMRGLGCREPIIVAVAVRVVFGLARAVNLIAGYIVNRVT